MMEVVGREIKRGGGGVREGEGTKRNSVEEGGKQR